MRSKQSALATLLGLALPIHLSLAVPDDAPYDSSLMRGQGFLTFRRQRAMLDAVLIEDENAHRNSKRARFYATSNISASNPLASFGYTPPSASLSGVDDLVSYFAPRNPRSIHKDIDRYRSIKAEKATTGLVKREEATACPAGQTSGQIYRTEEVVQDYEHYLTSIGVSASAAVSYFSVGATVSGSYLDQAQFSSNTLTYVVKIVVNKQQSTKDKFEFNMWEYRRSKDFHKDFGNRWIRGFKRGGQLLCRVSVTSKKSSNSAEVAASASLSVGFLQASGSVSSEVKSSMAKLSETAHVKIDFFYEGDLNRNLRIDLPTSYDSAAAQQSEERSPVQEAFEQAKGYVRTFENQACKHDYKSRVILERYAVISNFPRRDGARVKELRYDDAEAECYGVLKELVRIEEMATLLKKSSRISEKSKRLIDRSRRRMISRSREWIEATSIDPSKAIETADELFETFNREFFQKYRKEVKEESLRQRVAEWAKDVVSSKSDWHIGRAAVIKKEMKKIKNSIVLGSPRPMEAVDFYEKTCRGFFWNTQLSLWNELRLQEVMGKRVEYVAHEPIWSFFNDGTKAEKSPSRKATIRINNQKSWQQKIMASQKGDSIELEAPEDGSLDWWEWHEYRVWAKRLPKCDGRTACLVVPISYLIKVEGDCRAVPRMNERKDTRPLSLTHADVCELADEPGCGGISGFRDKNCPHRQAPCSFEAPVFDGDKPRVSLVMVKESVDTASGTPKVEFLDLNVGFLLNSNPTTHSPSHVRHDAPPTFLDGRSREAKPEVRGGEKEEQSWLSRILEFLGHSSYGDNYY